MNWAQYCPPANWGVPKPFHLKNDNPTTINSGRMPKIKKNTAAGTAQRPEGRALRQRKAPSFGRTNLPSAFPVCISDELRFAMVCPIVKSLGRQGLHLVDEGAHVDGAIEILLHAVEHRLRDEDTWFGVQVIMK